jgi:hypothetical protein
MTDFTDFGHIERCGAVCVARDDHWGGIGHTCERVKGHDGEHMSSMDACEPVAQLRWSSPDGT